MESPRSPFAVSIWCESCRRRARHTVRHDPSRAAPGSWDRRWRPKANHTAARSCDWTAVSADWLPLRVSASLPFSCAPTPAPKLQANEKALYRCPPFAFFFSPPWRGRRRSEWSDRPRKPPSVHQSPWEVHSQRSFRPITKRPRSPAVLFHQRARVSLSLTLQAFFLRVGGL